MTPERPDLDRARIGPQETGDLREGEHPPSAQAGEAVLEAVRVPHRGHDAEAEAIGDARTQAAGVEQLGDLAIGVIVDEAVDLAHDHRVDLAQLRRAERQRQLERARRATLEADLHEDPLGARQGHVLDDEAEKTLALALRRPLIAPQARQVCRESQDLGTGR